MNSVVGEFPSPTEVFITENSSGSLITDQHLNSDDSAPVPAESLADSSMQEKASSTNVSNVENHSRSSNTPAFNSGTGNHSCMPLEISTHLSMKGNDLYGLSGGNETTNSTSEDSIEQDLKSDDCTHIPLESKDGLSSEGKASHKFQDEAAGEVVLSTEVPIIESYSSSSNTDSALTSEDHSSVPIDSLTKLSLEEKVSNFMQNGDLDGVEGYFHIIFLLFA